MKKNHEIRVKLTVQELESIKRKADKLGLTPSTLLRILGLKANVNLEVGI